MRYKIMKFIDSITGIEQNRCKICGRKLSDVEKMYYECSCGKCEKRILDGLRFA